MAAPSTLVTSVSVHTQSREGWFYAGTGAFALLFSFAAFGPSMVEGGRRLGPITPLLAVHSLVYSAWLLLFITQAILVKTGRVALHRRLGTSSVILAAVLIIMGYQVTIAMGHRGYDLSGDLGCRSDPLAAMAFPLLDILVFAALFLAACLYRRRSATHKRLMLLAVAAGLMPAPITHLIGHYTLLRDKPFLTPLMVGAFLAAGAIHDRVKLGRIHSVSLWIALSIFLLDILWAVVIMPSAAWHAFGGWLIR